MGPPSWMILVALILQFLGLVWSNFPQQHENKEKRPFFKRGKVTDFESNGNVSVIAFGSCNKQTHPQPLWKSVIAQKPDLWIWLGDAVYADTRLLPFIWIIASLKEMQARYNAQKQIAEYKELLDSGIPIIGVWDDHDYGSDNGNKHFKYRLQSQNIFLDFLDEPLDSIRRSREGTYASYMLGSGKRKVKVILLDVRSNYEPASPCDLLGDKQWQWFENQLADESAELTIVGSGMQFLSDIPFIEKWQRCPSSLDKLVWLAQKRKHVFFISGDVHFSEVNCMNASSSGSIYDVLLFHSFYPTTHDISAMLQCYYVIKRSYPLYEVTSSSLTHSCSSSLLPYGICDWTLKNVVASCYRVSSVITENNFGIIRINWESEPVKVNFELHSEHGILTSTAVSMDDLETRRHPAVCPPAIEQPNWYWKRVFWYSVIVMAIVSGIVAIWVSIIACRWFIKAVLKDLDVKIKNGFVKLSKKNKAKHE